MSDQWPDGLEQLMRHNERSAALEDLRSLDRGALSAMDDKALAVWQTRHALDTPQWRLGEHEWQIRLLARQIKATHHAAHLSVVGTLLGVLLGFWMSVAVGK